MTSPRSFSFKVHVFKQVTRVAVFIMLVTGVNKPKLSLLCAGIFAAHHRSLWKCVLPPHCRFSFFSFFFKLEAEVRMCCTDTEQAAVSLSIVAFGR